MIDVNKDPWLFYKIKNPTDEQCLIAVKYNVQNIFMIQHLSLDIIKLVDPLYIQLWHDLRILNFSYTQQPINNQYQLICRLSGDLELIDYINDNYLTDCLQIKEFYPLFYNHFRKELRADKLINL